MEPTIASNTPLPEPFHANEVLTTSDEEADQAALNDQEAVGLFRDTIAAARIRDEILEALKGGRGSDLRPISSWTERLDNARHSRSYTSSIRSRISQLHYWNTVIVLDYHLSEASNETQEALKAAVKTIQLIEASQDEGVTMCLW
jgi:hypothetical protein